MERRTILLLAGPGAATVYAVVALLIITVWDPMAAAPQLSYAEIVSELAAHGVDVGAVTLRVGLWSAVGVALSGIVSALALTRVPRPWTVTAWQLGLLVAGAPAFFVASFALGMDVADTFGVTGQPHTPFTGVLYLVSALAFALLLVGELSPRLRRAIDGRFLQRTR
jgi:hypothetical protein